MSFSSSRNERGAPDDLSKEHLQERHPADEAAKTAMFQLAVGTWCVLWPGLSVATYRFLTQHNAIQSRALRGVAAAAFTYLIPYYVMDFGSK